MNNRMGTEIMTLSQAAMPGQSLLTKALLIVAGSLFIAAAAQVQVPMWPVPITLQTFAVLIVGFTLGARMGAATLVAYLAEGAVGLPVFAGLGSAPALLGPTAGFLYGFVAMAFLAGLAADAGLKKFLPLALVGIAVSAALYVPGLAWPALTMDVSIGDLLSGWMKPFLIGDAVKAIIAALVVAGGWSVVAQRRV
jgi:biotin transport system substrate-specific component